MTESKLKELAAKVERLAAEYVVCRRENSRLKRLLLSAETKIKNLSMPGASTAEGTNVMDLTRQVEKMKGERKVIKDKVEKMASRLEKFYRD